MNDGRPLALLALLGIAGAAAVRGSRGIVRRGQPATAQKPVFLWGWMSNGNLRFTERGEGWYTVHKVETGWWDVSFLSFRDATWNSGVGDSIRFGTPLFRSVEEAQAAAEKHALSRRAVKLWEDTNGSRGVVRRGAVKPDVPRVEWESVDGEWHLQEDFGTYELYRADSGSGFRLTLVHQDGRREPIPLNADETPIKSWRFRTVKLAKAAAARDVLARRAAFGSRGIVRAGRKAPVPIKASSLWYRDLQGLKLNQNFGVYEICPATLPAVAGTNPIPGKQKVFRATLVHQNESGRTPIVDPSGGWFFRSETAAKRAVENDARSRRAAFGSRGMVRASGRPKLLYPEEMVEEIIDEMRENYNSAGAVEVDGERVVGENQIRMWGSDSEDKPFDEIHKIVDSHTHGCQIISLSDKWWPRSLGLLEIKKPKGRRKGSRGVVRRGLTGPPRAFDKELRARVTAAFHRLRDKDSLSVQDALHLLRFDHAAPVHGSIGDLYPPPVAFLAIPEHNIQVAFHDAFGREAWDKLRSAYYSLADDGIYAMDEATEILRVLLGWPV